MNNNNNNTMLAKKDELLKYFNDLFYWNDIIYISLRFITYITVITVIAFFVFNWYLLSQIGILKDWIALVQNTNLLIEWAWDYKWIDYQIQYLNDFTKTNKASLKEKSKQLFERLDVALPDSLSRNYIAKYFEELFLSLSQQWNEVILNSIILWAPVEQKIIINSNDVAYQKYSVSVNFSATNTKFEQVIDLIHVSWVLDEKFYYKWQPLPVMTTSSINLNFNDKSNWVRWRTLQFFMYSYKKI